MNYMPWTICLLAILLLLANRSTESTKPKVFVIGLNKTGTTSLGNALQILGYRKLGWGDFISRKLFHDWYSGNLQSLIQYSTKYDAFEDLPWPFAYKEMAALYPDAKFILSVRANEEIWWRSIARHTEKRVWIGHKLTYGSYSATKDKAAYIDLYLSHQQRVRGFFKNQPERLLEINIDESANWNKLCDFLGCSTVPKLAFPKSNTKNSFLNADPTGFLRAWDNFLSSLETVIVSHWYYNGHPKFVPGKATGKGSLPSSE
jgi:hypothetical protein